MMRGAVKNNVKTTLDNRDPKRTDALSAQLEAQKARDDYKLALIEQMRAKLKERTVHKNANN